MTSSSANLVHDALAVLELCDARPAEAVARRAFDIFYINKVIDAFNSAVSDDERLTLVSFDALTKRGKIKRGGKRRRKRGGGRGKKRRRRGKGGRKKKGEGREEEKREVT
jgi:hypothetical protein